MDLSHQLEIARSYHISKRLTEAEIIYRAILKHEPENAQAMQLLGVLVAQAGQPAQGLQWLEQAHQLAPERLDIYQNLAGVLQQLGKQDQALECYQQIIVSDPDFAPALFQLGRIYRTHGKWSESESHLNRALEINPQFFEAWGELASLYQSQGRGADAERALQQALQLQEHPLMWFSLANLYWRQGRHLEAVECYRQVLQLSPEHLEALCNLAGVLRYLKQPDEAKTCLQKACELHPHQTLPWLGLGSLALEMREMEQARNAYQQAINQDATCLEAWVNLAVAWQELGEFAEARACYDQALKLRPNSLEIRLRRATLLPVLLTEAAQAQSLRQQFNQELDSLEQIAGKLDTPERQIGQTPYLLAPHGLDDRFLQERLNRLYRRLAPSLNFQAPPLRKTLRKSKLRLGFVSEYLRSHPIGRLLGGMIEQLPREHFEISLFYFPNCHDTLARQLQASCDRAIALPYQLEQAQHLIEASELDILFYPEIGLSTFTYCLAFARLAPVQCATWGFASTSGIDSIDYFFSSQGLEPADAQRFYTESLIQMQELIPFYTQPLIPAKSQLELPAGRIYLCPQSLYKLQPDFDVALAGILAADSQAQLLLIDGPQSHWKDLLIKRWQTLMGPYLPRIHFLPRLPHQEYLALLARADVILSPFEFGGSNSSYEAMAAGTPVITLPGKFLRGRVSAALYQRMGLDQGIAVNMEEYVGKAVKMAQDRHLNHSFRRDIAERRDVLYRNQKAVSELAQLLRETGQA